MADAATLIRRLNARRAELLRDLAKIEDTLDDEPPKDWEDRAVERQGDEVLESLGQHDQDELRRIDAVGTDLCWYQTPYGFVGAPSLLVRRQPVVG